MTVADRIARALVGVAFAASLGVVALAGPGGQAVNAFDTSEMIKAVEPIANFCFTLG